MTELMQQLETTCEGMEAEAIPALPAYVFIKEAEAELMETIKNAASGCDISFGIKHFLEVVIDHLSISFEDSERALYKFLGEGV